MRKTLPFPLLIIILSIILASLMILGICLGSVQISIKSVIEGIFRTPENTHQFIIRTIRIPRVLGSVPCGAMLGVCGVVFQAVFRNPMAVPYLLGGSSGASLAVALGSLAG